MTSTTIALPSKGAIADPTYNFLRESGLKVSKPNPRQYTGSIPAVPGLGVLFQRVKDVVYKVADGTAQLGITGLDVVHEYYSDNLIVIHDKLGYGHCQLVVAVPEAWVDVQNVTDLAEIAHFFREDKKRHMRIATTYPHLTREFLHKHHIHHFTLVKADGAIEAAPTIGYADIIVDVTQTGTTLRENHLKQIEGGTILEAQACLIGNRDSLRTNPEVLSIVRKMSELIDAAQAAHDLYQITVDIRGNTAEDVAGKLTSHPLTRGLLGPTIAPIVYPDGDEQHGCWHTVTITTPAADLLPVIDQLRGIGAANAIVMPVKYVFRPESTTYRQLLDRLELS